jgi:membrane protease YdiL (CAAX protease family)
MVPVTLFVSAYLATFWCVEFVSRVTGWRPVYLIALAAAAGATAFCNAVIDAGRWRIGFFVAPHLAARELVLGLAFAIVLIGAGDVVIILMTNLRHAPGNGFPWRELVIVFIPAVVHEELVFRGYLYQKIRGVSRVLSIAVTSLAFAFLHTKNSGATPVAIANIAVAGVLLALAFETFQRLWFPIGIHLAWNVASGPLLGYPVSGYVPSQSVMRTIGSGPRVVTGGAFGIEASVVMLIVESCAVVLLWRAARMRAERT